MFQELASLRSEMSGTVSVDLQAAPAVDLQRVLDDIRAEYEGVARRSQEEAERWFVKQVSGTHTHKILFFLKNLKKVKQTEALTSYGTPTELIRSALLAWARSDITAAGDQPAHTALHCTALRKPENAYSTMDMCSLCPILPPAPYYKSTGV